MARIIIIGASIGGLPAAYEMRAVLDESHDVTVVSNTPVFHFVPSNPWVATGFRDKTQTSFEIAPYLQAKNITFSAAGVVEILAEQNQVRLGDDAVLDYDYLIVATGPKLAFGEINGLGPNGYTQSICTLDHAEQAHDAWQQFMTKPGPIVIGAVQGASCFGPAYEYALMLSHTLRQAKIRDQVPMTFVTAEPYIGHLGMGGVGDSKGLLESEFRKHDIQWITNARVTEVSEGAMHIEQVNEQGDVIQHHDLPFDYSMLLPAFNGVDCVANLGGDAVNPRGFLNVDEFQRNSVYPNIYGVGVCIAIPSIDKTPIPVGAPKTGYMIESMASTAVHNIKACIDGKVPDKVATWNALCLADFGETGAAFIAMPQIPPRNTAWMKKGKWVRWAKIAYEKYFLYKVKQGSVEPIYEKKILKLLGITKIK
jgi:sulfide:quinone oxidoreductase